MQHFVLWELGKVGRINKPKEALSFVRVKQVPGGDRRKQNAAFRQHQVMPIFILTLKADSLGT